jgi:hypothetical protein
MTMAGLPIDTARLALIAMSGARPGAAFAELSDGSTRRFVPGQQGTDRATGLPLWEVDAVAPAAADDERGRMTTLTVKIAAQYAPDDVTPGQPVRFVDLEVRPAVGKRDGKLALYWSASGVAPAAAVKPFGAGTEKAA